MHQDCNLVSLSKKLHCTLEQCNIPGSIKMMCMTVWGMYMTVTDMYIRYSHSSYRKYKELRQNYTELLRLQELV